MTDEILYRIGREYTELVRSIAMSLCQHNRITRDMPSEADIQMASDEAKNIISWVSNWVEDDE